MPFSSQVTCCWHCCFQNSPPSYQYEICRVALHYSHQLLSLLYFFFSLFITHRQTTSLTHFLSSSIRVYMPYGGVFFLLVSFTLTSQVLEHYKLLSEQEKQLSSRNTEWPITGNCTYGTGSTGNVSGPCSVDSSLSAMYQFLNRH